MKPRVRIKNGRPVLQPIDATAVNEELVATLEHLLEDARKGEVQSLYYGAAWKGSRYSTGFSVSRYTDRHTMLGHGHLALAEFQDAVRLWHSDSVLNDAFDV